MYPCSIEAITNITNFSLETNVERVDIQQGQRLLESDLTRSGQQCDNGAFPLQHGIQQMSTLNLFDLVALASVNRGLNITVPGVGISSDVNNMANFVFPSDFNGSNGQNLK